MHLTRRSLAGLALAMPALVLSRPAVAAEPEVFQSMGIAINGTDPVAYFKDGAPVAGSMVHRLAWHGAGWVFASEQNRVDFESDPLAFAPRFGGYCALAASKGALAPTIPEAWTIHEGRLYLNANLRAREIWLQDIPGNVAAAEANWPAILGQA